MTAFAKRDNKNIDEEWYTLQNLFTKTKDDQGVKCSDNFANPS